MFNDNSIDYIHQKAVEGMRAQQNLKFSLGLLRADGKEKVRMTLDLLENLKLLPESSPMGKCSIKSAEHREIGNGFFRARKNLKALYSYNQAIAIAPSQSRELGLSYGNRSAVLFKLKRYESCAIDCDRALQLLDDPKLIKKYSDRKEQCLKNATPEKPIQDIKNPLVDIKTSHPSYPCASTSLRVAFDQEYGRYIVAAEDIEPGEVLVFEKPYTTVLLPDQIYRRCFECCEQTDSPIPCPNCRHAMYCSTTCKDNSYVRYHKFECPIMDFLITMDFTKIELIALRTAIVSRTDHVSWEQLESTIKNVESSEPEFKGFVKIENNSIFDSKYYASVHSLETNSNKRDASDLFLRCISAAVLLHLTKTTTLFDDCEPGSDHVMLFGSLLLHHYMTSASNMHSLYTLYESDGEYINSIQFASGAYPFLSLFNHSCAPHVQREHVGNAISMLALRPIKKGQQIFDNYGQHHAMQVFPSRQMNLFNQYKFKCRCEACSGNWPVYSFLTNKNIPKNVAKYLTDTTNEELHNNLKRGRKDVALFILNKLYEDVKTLEPYSPCLKLAQHQETIKQCWSLFGNVLHGELIIN